MWSLAFTVEAQLTEPNYSPTVHPVISSPTFVLNIFSFETLSCWLRSNILGFVCLLFCLKPYSLIAQTLLKPAVQLRMGDLKLFFSF